jgi:hypothetical protein
MTSPSAKAARMPASAVIPTSDFEVPPLAVTGPGSAKSTISSFRPAASCAVLGLAPGASWTGVRWDCVWRTTWAAIWLARRAASSGSWAATLILSRRVMRSALAFVFCSSWVTFWRVLAVRRAASRMGRLVARSA